MIDGLLKQLFEKWNNDNKCGKCWVYLKTFNDRIKGTTNQVEAKEDTKCCVHVFLEDYSFKPVEEINSNTGYKIVTSCDYYVSLKMYEHSDYSMQKGDEVDPEYNTSIWDEIILPLMECVGCDFETDLCAIDPTLQITYDDRVRADFSKKDANWAGISLKMKFKKNIR